MGRTACTEPQCLYKGALYLLLYRNKLSNCQVKTKQTLCLIKNYATKIRSKIWSTVITYTLQPL